MRNYAAVNEERGSPSCSSAAERAAPARQAERPPAVLREGLLGTWFSVDPGCDPAGHGGPVLLRFRQTRGAAGVTSVVQQYRGCGVILLL